MRAELLLMVAVFVGVTAIAYVVGAANLGTAATFGQIAFGATATYVIVRPRR